MNKCVLLLLYKLTNGERKMSTKLKRNLTSEVYTELVTVTPEVATSWLSFNKHNRTLRKKTIDLYSQYMKNGEWLLNGESIKFSSENFLLDGQHRLSAIVKSGAAVEMIVMHNLSPDTFKTIDTGKKRSGGDSLSVAGYTNSSRLSAGIACFIRYNRKQLFNNVRHHEQAISNSQILEFAQANPDIIDDMYEVIANVKLFKVAPPSVVIGLYPLIKSADAEKAEAFVNILANGYDDRFVGNSAAIALRNKLTSVRFADRKPRQGEYANYFVVSWNSFYREIVTTVAKKSGKTDSLTILGAKNIWDGSNE